MAITLVAAFNFVFFLNQANRIRAGKSSVPIRRIWILSVVLSTR